VLLHIMISPERPYVLLESHEAGFRVKEGQFPRTS